ncbi:hypothetical protein L7F22_054936 [Adiantum nelumboides]|nr:hypothetical protein [Adiantum nelumboides]
MAGLDKNPEVRQLIIESYASFLQVILESRLFSAISTSGNGSSSSTHGPQSPAFNLVLGNSGSIKDKMGPWSRGVWEPMVIDILYLKRVFRGMVGQNMVQNVRKLAAQGSLKVALEVSGSEQAIFLERWTVEFVQHTGASSIKIERELGLSMERAVIGRYWRLAQKNKYKVIPLMINERFGTVGGEYEAVCINVEKNISILLRSLYSTTRLLPAHNLSRLLTTTGKCKSRLAYRVTTADSLPLPESDKKNMTSFCFPLADCHFGHLRITVAYRRTVPMEEQKVHSLPPQVIMDYVGKHQLKQLPGEKIGHVHSLPSAWRLSSFKASNRELHQPLIKERASKDGQTKENQTFDCPFAINEEVHDRQEAANLYSVKSNVGMQGIGPQEDPSLRSLMAMLRLTRHNQFLSCGPTKTATDALKELKLYIDLKNNFLSKCT